MKAFKNTFAKGFFCLFFCFFFKQHGKSEVEMVNELWLGESLVSGEQRYFPSGTLLF